MSQKSYVHDGEEVVLTGREAIRTVKTVSGDRELKKVEITPIAFATGGGWLKWVDPGELYQII
jgi:hypothetical protein